MGNALGGPSVNRRPPRSTATQYREALPSPPLVDIRRKIIRQKLTGELTQRPLTATDIEEIRTVLIQLSPSCDGRHSTDDGCSLSPNIRNSLIVIESAEGRTLSQAETDLLLAQISDDAPTLTPQPSRHPRLSTAKRFSACDCQCHGCSECGAGAFWVSPLLSRQPMTDRISNR